MTFYNAQYFLPMLPRMPVSSLADKCINTDMSVKSRLVTKCQLARINLSLAVDQEPRRKVIQIR